ERLQPLLDTLTMKHCRIGNQHELYAIEATPALDRGHQFDNLGELEAGGGLAVTGKGQVVEPPQRFGRLSEALILKELPALHAVEHVLQLVAQAVEVHVADRAWRAAINLAVDTVEVAALVRVEVQPDADTLAAPGHDGVDIEVVGIGAAMIAVDQR